MPSASSPASSPAPPPLGFASLSALLLALTLGGTGCGSTPKADTFDAAVAAGERPVAMRGDMPYFGGRLNASVTISRGVGRGNGVVKGHKSGVSPTEGEKLDADSYSAYMQARGA